MPSRTLSTTSIAIFGALVSYLLVRDGMVWRGYAIHQRGTEGIDHICDAAIAIGFNMMRELCGALPDEVLLSHRAPADVHPYRRFFRVPVRFDAEQSAVVFPANLLERQVPGADARQRAILEGLVAQYWSIAQPTVAEQVVRILCPRVLWGECTLEVVAHCLAMHPRTLNRHLQAEGTTFRKLLNEAHFEVARQVLAGTRIHVTGIATALGYAEPGAFSHAFHRMAGVSPFEWRAGSGPQRLAVEARIGQG